MEMKSKEIRAFLSELNDTEFHYLNIQFSLARDSRNMVNEFNLTKERFCELMQIDITLYDAFLNGGFDYDIMKMALLKTAWVKLRSEQAKEEAEKILTGIAK